MVPVPNRNGSRRGRPLLDFIAGVLTLQQSTYGDTDTITSRRPGRNAEAENATTQLTLLSGISARALTRHASVAIVVRSERYQTTHARKPFLTPRSRPPPEACVCALWCSTNLMTILGPNSEAVSQSARSCPTSLMRDALTRGVHTCRHAGCKEIAESTLGSE